MSFTAARISNWIAPFSSTPFGAMYSSAASQLAFSIAPTVIFTGISMRTLPTSLSSTLPWKIRSFMSAMAAMVVPSLKLLRSITLLPSFTGTSSTMPVIVLRTTVLPALVRLIPSRTTSRPSCAASRSCLAFLRATSKPCISAALITPLSASGLLRS